MPLLSDPKPPSLRSTRALPRILAVLSDKLSPESGSSGGSIFTLLQIIFNKFASYLVISTGDKSSFFT